MTMTEKFEEITIFGIHGLFSNGRLVDAEIPDGLYRYDLRGSDDDPGDPVVVEKTVVVNHAASVITGKPLNLGDSGCLYLMDDEDDEGLNFTGALLTVKEFIRDEKIRDLWVEFGDIPMNPETEEMEETFLDFPAGTHREEIWHWFDEQYSDGVAALMYPNN